jgi:hypothetical protein
MVAFAPQRGLLLTASGDGTVRLWEDGEGGALVDTLVIGTAVSGALFSPDEQWVYLTTRQRLIRWPVPYERRDRAAALEAIRCRLPLHLSGQGVLVQGSACAAP